MPRIAIVGPGAIGGVMAAHLSAAHELVLCARRPVPELVVESPDTTVTIRPPVFTDPVGAPAVDWVLVTTKTYDAAGAAEWLPALTASGAPVAIVQNGVEHRERFAGVERLLPVLAYCPVERASPTRIRQRGRARFVAPDSVDGAAFARLFDGTAVQVTVTPDFRTAAWEKLCFNALGAINAVLLRPCGIFHDEAVAAVARGLARECIAVGRAEGARLDDALADRVVQMYRNLPADSVNSLHADRMAGRPMEVDARNGAIVRLGRRHGIDTPLNATFVALLEALGLPA
jgi:2-dehydropantoate 2-reductase